MDRAFYKQVLAMAERHVTQGNKHISNQRRIIAELKERGANSTEAESLLVAFLEAQKWHEYHRQQLIDEITKTGEIDADRN